MDFLFAKGLTSIGIIVFICNIWLVNKMASISLIFWNNIGIFWSKVSIVACISLILSSKVNRVDFKCSKGFLEKFVMVPGVSSLKVIKNKFDRI